MMDTDFSFDRVVNRATQGWWLVVVFAILGGLAGFALSALRPAVYEARAEYTFSIDFARTGILTDVEQDQAFEAMSDVVFSTQVLEQTARAAQAEGIAVDLTTLQENITKERALNTWTFRVRHADPAAAVRIANLWGENGLHALQVATAAALEAGVLRGYLDSLESCLSRAVMSEPVQALCETSNLARIQAEIDKTGAAIASAREESRGILPGMGYQWTRDPGSAERVLAGRGLLVLAGALVGLIVAVIGLEMGLLERRAGHPGHA